MSSKRKSQIELAIDKAQAEIDQLNAFIARLRDQQTPKSNRKPLTTIRIRRRRRNGEGAATDSGNMNDPPA